MIMHKRYVYGIKTSEKIKRKFYSLAIQLNSIEAHERFVASLAYSGDATQIATTSYSGGVIKFWETETGNLLANVDRSQTELSNILSIAFSKDGTRFALASQAHVEIWKAKPRPQPASRSARRAAEGLALGDVLPVL